MKHIYISPHADDVALSCGGQIIANPDRCSDTMVLTVFTSELPDEDRQAGPGEKAFRGSLNCVRSAEDRSAWESLGVKAESLDLPEALLRKRFPFSIITSGKDDKVADQLFDLLKAYSIAHPGAMFYFPAGFGNHIDHVVCRNVAFRLLDQGIVAKLVLYEDIPYSWLRFIRKPYYKLLLRGIRLDKSSLATAYRAGGLTMADYLRGTLVPFPRGKKLFLMVGIVLLLRRLFQDRRVGASSTVSAPNPDGSGRRSRIVARRFRRNLYSANIEITELNDSQVNEKKSLLFKYKSQIPMLFGANPYEALRAHRDFFTSEVRIELAIT